FHIDGDTYSGDFNLRNGYRLQWISCQDGFPNLVVIIGKGQDDRPFIIFAKTA
ncbi:hypothetical protein AAVH_22113, partial [Aphelenchoides avenae]